jgi:FkbM family methyltransferase
MSRFTNLKKQLGFWKAIFFYRKIKSGNLVNLVIDDLAWPFTLRNNPYDYATFEEVLLHKTYDISLSFTPEYIIDGGGNIGLTACYFATKYSGAIIVSIEPDSENFKMMQANCRQYTHIKILQNGIWKKNTHLKIADSQVGNNAFTVEETDYETPDSLKAVTIQHIMELYDMPHIDILKLDIEGSEKEVFEENFESWLPKTKVLIIELHDEMKNGCSRAVFNAVNKYDFSFDIRGENIIFTNNALK